MCWYDLRNDNTGKRRGRMLTSRVFLVTKFKFVQDATENPLAKDRRQPETSERYYAYVPRQRRYPAPDGHCVI